MNEAIDWRRVGAIAAVVAAIAVAILLSLRACAGGDGTSAESSSGSTTTSPPATPGPAPPTSTGQHGSTPTLDPSTPAGSATSSPGTATPTTDPPTPTPTTPSTTPAPTPPPGPLVIVASGGSAQSGDVAAAYGRPLVVRVTTDAGAPVSGVRVIFRAPTEGPSGHFTTSLIIRSAASTSCEVTTDSHGHATSAPFWANDIPGAFTVSAEVDGVRDPIAFALTNGEPFDVALGPVSPALYPGRSPSVVPMTISNPNAFAISVVALTLTASNASCSPGTNLAIHQVDLRTSTTPGRLIVAAGGTVSLPTQGVSPPTIALRDTGVDQTASCAGQVFDLHATGLAAP